MKSRTALWLALALAVAVARPAHADRRILGYTYPYMTLPAGAAEVEHYLDARLQKSDDPSTAGQERQWRPSWQHQVELEYGITDRLDFGFYNVFAQKPYGSMEYEGIKLRSRYRFADQGDLPLDIAVYAEGFYYNDEAGFEERLILSKSVKQLELHLNLKTEQEWAIHGPGREMELVLNPSAGAGYHIASWVAVGAEYYGRTALEEEKWSRMAHYAGPTLSFMGKRFWWTVTFQPQLSRDTGRPDYQARSLLALQL